MSRITSPQRPAQYPQSQGQWPAPRSGGASTVGLIAGLVVLGVGGAILWNYLGPDLRRYLKIRSM